MFLSKIKEYPYLEKFIKAGLYKLADEKIKNGYSNTHFEIDKNATSLSGGIHMPIHKQYLNPNISSQNIYGMNLSVVKRENNIMHTHNYHEFMLVKKGEILHKYQTGEEILKEHQLCFVRASDFHSISLFSKEAAEIYNIGITERLFEKVFNYYNCDYTFLISSQKPVVINLSMADFEILCKKIDFFSNAIFGDLHSKMFYNLLSEFAFLISTPQKHNLYNLQNVPNWLLKIIKEMQKPDNFIEGLPKLLSITTYSQEYISRCFRKYLGLSATEYINSLRLNYAKKLILEDNIPISQACYECGFNCEGYFYKEFKELFSMTPKQMKNHKENSL